jgi:hypothetical protein
MRVTQVTKFASNILNKKETSTIVVLAVAVHVVAVVHFTEEYVKCIKLPTAHVQYSQQIFGKIHPSKCRHDKPMTQRHIQEDLNRSATLLEEP